MPAMPAPRRPLRQGTILILVAGISALLVCLAAAFLARMRSDAEEMASVMREAQARIMLLAACNWLQEASRIGWEPAAVGAAPVEHLETFGWIDVRDGKLGPKYYGDNVDDDSRFPLGSSRRFPMHVLQRPPCAVQLTAAYNPIRTTVSPQPVSESDPLFGMPYLCNPDPQPVVRNGWLASNLGTNVSATLTVTESDGTVRNNWASYLAGDPRPRGNSTGMSWFRLFRDGGATFVVTCGGGGTQGFRTWAEVQAAGQTAAFADDQDLFTSLLASECRLFYRVEWNGACMAMDYHYLMHSRGRDFDHYVIWPLNASHSEGVCEYRTQNHARNMGGTILWIQRLRTEPTNW